MGEREEGKRVGAMKVVLLGATGATGRLLARQLVAKKHHVTAIVRNTETEALSGLSADHLKQVRGTVLGMCDESLEQLVQGCDAVLICLGHTISFSGIFGKPRLLVTDTLKKIVKAVDAANKSENKIVKLVLMNSVGVRNKGLEVIPTTCPLVYRLLLLITMSYPLPSFSRFIEYFTFPFVFRRNTLSAKAFSWDCFTFSSLLTRTTSSRRTTSQTASRRIRAASSGYRFDQSLLLTRAASTLTTSSIPCASKASSSALSKPAGTRLHIS